MIKSFKTENCQFDDYLQKVLTALSERDLNKIINISCSGNEVKISFNKLGKSELVYALSKNKTGFECTHQSEKLAITHRAMRKDIDSRFSAILQKLGATVEQG